MAIGFNTKVQEDGTFVAEVYRVEYQKPHDILKVARFDSRAKATGFAKKWTLYYRKGGV